MWSTVVNSVIALTAIAVLPIILVYVSRAMVQHYDPDGFFSKSYRLALPILTGIALLALVLHGAKVSELFDLNHIWREESPWAISLWEFYAIFLSFDGLSSIIRMVIDDTSIDTLDLYFSTTMATIFVIQVIWSAIHCKSKKFIYVTLVSFVITITTLVTLYYTICLMFWVIYWLNFWIFVVGFVFFQMRRRESMRAPTSPL